MSYTLSLRPHAARQLRKLPKSVQEFIAPAISRLAEQPRPPGSKKLQASEAYRLRVGDYRVVYVIDDRARTVDVKVIAHRREVYR